MSPVPAKPVLRNTSHTIEKNPIPDCTAVILAGGENRRMPLQKAFIRVNGRTIISKTVKMMKALSSEVFIITNNPEDYLYKGVSIFGDIYDIRGPMTGIFTSLLNSAHPWVLVCACDMPFINSSLIRYMASKRSGTDAVVPLLSVRPFSGNRDLRTRPEPLLAFYSAVLIHDMEKALLNRKRSMTNFLHSKSIQYVKMDEIREYDPDMRSFINLNTPEDVDSHLSPEDRDGFLQMLERKGKCLV